MISPPPRRGPRPRTALLGVLGAVVLFGAGVVVGGHPRSTGINDLPSGVRGVLQGDTGDPVAGEVLGLLQDGYFEKVDAAKLERASVDGLVKSLGDRYTYYLDPEEYAALQRQTEGIFFGVGMQVSTRGKYTVVADVYPDSPAARGGVKAGDIIAAVDGATVVGKPLETVVAAVRGPEGTTVRIRLVRKGEPARVVTLTRSRIKVRLVTSRVEAADGRRVGYVRLAEFDRGASAQLRDAVKSLQSRKITSLVFDLRGDPGGLVDEAVGVVGVFTRQGSPVVTTKGLHRDRETLRTNDAQATSLPLVVLVDRNSASASEIVSGALRDNDRAVVVGTRTFGKALVQTTRELRNGGALHYTTARYLTPDGVDVSKNGLKPDIAVKDDPATTVDEALQRALRAAAARG
ncbi:MAG: S41 family peptidase [Thermoleophilia bacterium]|nr:S41 family peptidase [Thermoleophilia bacterium]